MKHKELSATSACTTNKTERNLNISTAFVYFFFAAGTVCQVPNAYREKEFV